MQGMNRCIGDNMFVICKHVPISSGFSWGNDYYKDYFGTDCITYFVRDLLDIEGQHNIKLNKPMVFTTVDELYHKANNICHVCSKQCINKVRDHCHKTGTYRGPACKMCKINYKDHIFKPVVFNNGKDYEFNLLFDEIFNQDNKREK